MNRTIFDKDVHERWCHWMVIQGCTYGFDRVLGIKEFLETPSKQYSKGTLYDEWVWKYPQGSVNRQSKRPSRLPSTSTLPPASPSFFTPTNFSITI